MRAKEIDRLLSHAKRRETVRLVAGRSFGSTTLLGDLAAALDSRGYTVLRLAGDPSQSGVRYGALRAGLPGAGDLGPDAEPTAARDAVSREIERAGAAVLLVDDAEWLDLASAQALAPVLARREAAGVLVSAPFSHLQPERRVTASEFRADARIELPSLSFEQLSVLAERVLELPVSPAVAAETLEMSSGIAGVAADVLRSARATGQLQRSEHRWEPAAPTLWNEHLEETVERLLAPLDDASVRLMHALSLAGTLPADELRALDDDSADALARSGLVDTFRDEAGRASVSPTPALIADYFRERPVDLLGIAAADTVAAAPVAQAGSGPWLARGLREDAEQRVARAARAWHERPDAARAADYLDALLRSGGHAEAASAVLERADLGGASGRDLLELALHALVRRNGAAGSPTDAEHRIVAALRAEHPEHAAAHDAYVTYLRFSEHGLTGEVVEWLAEPGRDPLGISDAVAAHIVAVTGAAQAAGAPAAAPRPAKAAAANPFVRAIAEQSRAAAALRAAAGGATAPTSPAQGQFPAPGEDPASFLVDCYVRALTLIGSGSAQEARLALSRGLAVGSLDPLYGALSAAMLRWSALLHARDGSTDIAASLLEESRERGSATGPLPGMREGFGDAISALVSGERERASELLLAEARACGERGLPDTAGTMARLAFQLAPGEHSLAFLGGIGWLEDPAPGAVGSHLPATARWSAALTDFARAAVAGDPEITTAVPRITGESELAAAADVLDDLECAGRERGTAQGEDFLRAVAEARRALAVLRAPLTAVPPRVRPAPETLTPRELEIAPLTSELSNREIAERLGLSVRTVENHIARAMKKLGLSSRTELLAAIEGAEASTRCEA